MVLCWSALLAGCGDATAPALDRAPPDGSSLTGGTSATGALGGAASGGKAGDSAIGGDGQAGASQLGGGGAGNAGAGLGGSAGGAGDPHPLDLLETAVELGRSTITQRSYSALGVERADYAFAGAMGGRAVTYRGIQYVVYYEADGTVMVARRDVTRSPVEWQKSAVGGYRVTTDDRHNKMAIAISRGDGTLHLAFDHHVANELHYARSSFGFASAPDVQVWNDQVFGYVENLGHDAWFQGTFPERTVTYPSFLERGDDILLYWRSGGAAQGRMNIANYDTGVHDWQTRRTFTSELGTYREGNWSSTQRGPYHAGFVLDPSGTLHVAWLWREAGCTQPGVRYCNHGLYYASSPDLGVHWQTGDGAPLAGAGEAIGVEDVKPVWDIGIELDPSNTNLQSRFVESTGALEVYVNHKDAAGGTSRSTYRYTRAANGSWDRRKTNATPGGLGVKIPPNGPGDVPNQTWDYGRLEGEGIASVVYQDEPAQRGAATPLYVIDYRFAE